LISYHPNIYIDSHSPKCFILNYYLNDDYFSKTQRYFELWQYEIKLKQTRLVNMKSKSWKILGPTAMCN